MTELITYLLFFRCSGVEHFLTELLPKLSNTEFILNSRDWPQISKHFGEIGPVLSFSKTPDFLDIQFPAWSFWEGGPAISSYPRGLGRWDIMRENLIKENEKWPWEKKLAKGLVPTFIDNIGRNALHSLMNSYCYLSFLDFFGDRALATKGTP